MNERGKGSRLFGRHPRGYVGSVSFVADGINASVFVQLRDQLTAIEWNHDGDHLGKIGQQLGNALQQRLDAVAAA